MFLFQAVYNVISYDDRMRVKTAMELLKATDDIEKQLEKVSICSSRKWWFQTMQHSLCSFLADLVISFSIQLILENLQVSSPLLILHGAADKVTDPNISRFLYENASSKDKTLKLYEGGFHCILEGEPDEVIFTVLNDIIHWLDSRCSST